jgi:uncharacterized protein
MILIADSSALVALSICHSLDLLEPLFGEVQVPKAVFDEVTISQKTESIGLAGFLKGKVITVDTNRYVYLDAYADAGETEAMLLYKQINADWLLIDDKRGRKVATINQIKTIGSLGVLLTAKKKGLISAVRPKLDLLSKSNLYFSLALHQLVLELANE